MAEPTRPVLGYLTTSWTPPASCFSVQVPGTDPTSPWTMGYQGRTCITARSWPSDAPDCWPPRTPDAPHPPTWDLFGGWGFYSPGTLCPSGFTTACVATYGEVLTDWSSPQFPPTAGETAAGCCPSGGYTCHSIYPVDSDSKTYSWAQTCKLWATSTTIEVAPCVATTDGVASQLFSEVFPYTSSITTESATSTYTYSTFLVLAPLIQINWRAEDLATPTSTSATSSNASAGRNISGGAIAGIVIGAVLGLTGTAIGIFWCVRKKRTRVTDVTAERHGPDCAPSQQQSPSVKSQQHTPQPLELLTTESTRELPERRAADDRLRVELQG